MRLKPLICCPLVAAFFLTACSVTHKATLPTLTVTENAAGVNYRGKYTTLTDIIHTRLDLSFNWDSAFVVGKATIQAKPYFYPSGNVVLDANGFKINSVELVQKDDKEPLHYTYDGKKLNIQLNKTYTRDQEYTLCINYVAMPEKLQVGKDISSAANRGMYFINKDGRNKNKPRQIWTQGETECNSTWFPTINGPQEKMTQELHITVPDEMVTLSNGSLEFSTLNGNGTRTDTWRQEQRHSTYLTMLAVGDFTITKDTWRNKEVSYYTEPAFASTAKLVFGKTPEMMEFFSNKLDIEFPWDKYSQIVVRDFVSGAMENTTATVFFDRMNMTEGQYLDTNYEDIIAHELFHHWFGDLVTAESWANLPLNEAFATYGEYLWYEYKYGRDIADLKGLEDLLAYIKNAHNRPQVDVIRYNYADRDQMFDDVTYQKGGRILHMLRKTVGDDAFFKSLNLYLNRHAYKTVEINDLRLAFEEVTGQDLNWFFNQWFLASGHPILAIQSNYDEGKKELTVQIQQNQDLTKTPLYRLPIAVDIYAEGKKERQEIVLDRQSQSFSFPLEVKPDLVNVDAEKYLVAEKTEMKPFSQYVFQYQHAPLFMDRLEALLMLQNLKKESLARQTMMEALDDKNWALRQLAVEFSSELETAEKATVYQKIRHLALNDPESKVRAVAVKALALNYKGFNNTDVFEEALKDKSPSVVKAATAARKE
ncbi:MAG TPA: M1 family metallopeptidase [Daejeonella sp.]|nr:M1 family metallopeptidase [Daejeonella sp.]